MLHRPGKIPQNPFEQCARKNDSVRKTEPMYKLKRRTFNVDELVPYLFMLTPIITALLVLFLWVVTDAG